MTATQLLNQVLNMWCAHNRINLYLLEEIPSPVLPPCFTAIASFKICAIFNSVTRKI